MPCLYFVRLHNLPCLLFLMRVPLSQFRKPPKHIPLPLGEPQNTSLSLWERSGEGFHIASQSYYAGGVSSPNLPQRGRDLHIRRSRTAPEGLNRVASHVNGWVNASH